MKEEKSAGDGDRAIPPLASFRLGFSSNNRFDDVFFPIASIIFFAPPSQLSPCSLPTGESLPGREADVSVERMRINSSSKRPCKRGGQRGGGGKEKDVAMMEKRKERKEKERISM